MKCALKYRYDRDPGPNAGETITIARNLRPRSLDQIRGQQALPAWGGRSINSANLHRVNLLCLSLIDLSAVDQRVYDRCHDRVLRVEDGQQPSLSMGNMMLYWRTDECIDSRCGDSYGRVCGRERTVLHDLHG